MLTTIEFRALVEEEASTKESEAVPSKNSEEDLPKLEKERVINGASYSITHTVKKDCEIFTYKQNQVINRVLTNLKERGEKKMVSSGGTSFEMKVNYELKCQELIPVLIRVELFVSILI